MGGHLGKSRAECQALGFQARPSVQTQPSNHHRGPGPLRGQGAQAGGAVRELPPFHIPSLTPPLIHCLEASGRCSGTDNLVLPDYTGQ